MTWRGSGYQAEGVERRVLTVLMCDLVGSTPLGEALDPEDYGAVMEVYSQLCNGVIDGFEGHISTWVGDGVTVLFGYPRAHDDDAIRAVRCGWEIVRAIEGAREAVEREHGVELAVRAGLDTGLTVVGARAADSQGGTLPYGGTPNVAARTQSAGRPGTVTVTDRTFRLVEGHFRFKPLGDHELKGLAEPLELYELVEPLVERRFEAQAHLGLTPLVGRTRELAALRSACESARAGTRRALLLRGEPGVGKSRLAHAACAIAGELGMQTLEFVGSAYHQGDALHPLIEGLRGHWELTGDGASERLAARAPDERSAALLADLLSIDWLASLEPMSAQRRRAETLEALVRALGAEARRQPLLCVLEDLHLVDPSTVELLTMLVAGPPDLPLLVVVTARPEARAALGDEFELLALEPLDRATTMELVHRAAELPAEVVRAVAERADGVPLFAEELARAASRAGDDAEIPTSLQGCLMALLDRRPDARRVAQLAAMVGREFEVALLEALGEFDAGELGSALATLADEGLVAATGEGGYAFRHSLIQDAARALLLRKERRRFDSRIAAVLVERFPELAAEQPERVARHFEQGGDLREAVEQWQQAGLLALQRSALREASGHLEHALELVAELPDSAQLELALRVLAPLPRVATEGWTAPAVVAHYERAEQLCAQVEGAPQLIPALLGLTTYRLVSGRLDDAVSTGVELVAVAESTGDAELILEVECETGNALFYLARHHEALERISRVLELYDPERHAHHALLYGRDPGAIALLHRAMSQWCVGDEPAAMATASSALELAKRARHPFSQAWVHSARAALDVLRGDTLQAREHAEIAITLAMTEGFPNWLAQASVYRGWALAMEGEHAAGLKQVQEGVALWEAGGAAIMRPMLLGVLADTLYRTGATTDALETVDAALGWTARADRWYEPELHRLRAELLLAAGDGAAARASAQRSLELVRDTGALGFEPRAKSTLADTGRESQSSGNAR